MSFKLNLFAAKSAVVGHVWELPLILHIQPPRQVPLHRISPGGSRPHRRRTITIESIVLLYILNSMKSSRPLFNRFNIPQNAAKQGL